MAHKCDGCRYKGQHQEMMFRPMGVCTRELNLVDAVKNYEAEKCPYKKTNADRIRAMSDEELAEWLVIQTVYQESAFSPPSYRNFLTDRDDTKEKAIPDTVKWLKQPAED